MNPLIEDHMVVDQFVQAEIARRCQMGEFPDEPSAIANDLGLIDLPSGNSIRAWLCHAADAVLIDDYKQTVLITRLHNPGRGKRALPGGLLDVTKAGIETSLNAALREAIEETGIAADVLAQAVITQLGHRRHVRPFDIRQAWNNLPGTPVQKGELFTVSTLAFKIRLPGSLRAISLHAGDDATAVDIVFAEHVSSHELAVPDHLEMIFDALNV